MLFGRFITLVDVAMSLTYSSPFFASILFRWNKRIVLLDASKNGFRWSGNWFAELKRTFVDLLCVKSKRIVFSSESEELMYWVSVQFGLPSGRSKPARSTNAIFEFFVDKKINKWDREEDSFWLVDACFRAVLKYPTRFLNSLNEQTDLLSIKSLETFSIISTADIETSDKELKMYSPHFSSSPTVSPFPNIVTVLPLLVVPWLRMHEISPFINESKNGFTLSNFSPSEEPRKIRSNSSFRLLPSHSINEKEMFQSNSYQWNKYCLYFFQKLKESPI